MTEHATGGLRANSLSATQVVAQSIANIAPSTVMALGPALVFASAGNGTWLSYAIAMVIALVVGYCVAQLARRTASAGSLYAYAARGLGPWGGFLAGWALLLGYLGLAMATVVGFGLYFGAFLELLGLPGTALGAQLVLYLVAGALVTLLSFRDVRVSTRTALILEVVSIAAIAIVLVIVLVDNGLRVDEAQLTLEGTGLRGVGVGVVLGVLGFVGFESAASLGAESRNPFRAIPRAILWSAFAAGVLYIGSAYITVLGFAASGQPLAESGAPLNDLATGVGLSPLAYVIDLGLAISFLACAIACVNALARVLYAMAREGVVPDALGRVHAQTRTPFVALFVATPPMTLFPAALVAAGLDPIDTFALIATVATFGYLLAYLLASLAAPAVLHRANALTPGPAIAAVVALVVIVAVFALSVYPAPAPPMSLLPYVFLALMAAGAVWFAVVRGRSPGVARRVGTLADDDDPATAAPAPQQA